MIYKILFENYTQIVSLIFDREDDLILWNVFTNKNYPQDIHSFYSASLDTKFMK